MPDIRPWVFAAIAVVLLGIGIWLGVKWEHREVEKLETAWAKEKSQLAVDLAKASEALRSKETTLATGIADTGAAHLEKRNDAKGKSDKVVADLVRGTTRLRNELAGCETARAAATAEGRRQLDDAARLRADIAGAVVRAGAECDAQITGLQRVLTLEREVVNGRD